MDVPMEHVSSEDTVPPHPEGSNEETKEESIKVIYLESEKPGKGDEKDNEDVFTIVWWLGSQNQEHSAKKSSGNFF